MTISNCVNCGTKLCVVRDGRNYCPNCGDVDENQEWDKLLDKKPKEKKNNGN